MTLSMVEIYNEAVRSGAPGASHLAPSPNPFCLHPQTPQRSPALSHQGPPCPRASPAPGSEAGPSRPGGSPGGWPHPLGRAQPGVSAPGEAAQWGPQLSLPPPLPAPGAQAPPQASPYPPVLQMLSLGRSNRATAATAMNQRSSRSHALVTLTLRTASPSRGTGTAGTSAPEPCGGLAAPTTGLRPRPARSPLQARCTSSTWRGPSAPGRRGRPVHRRKTGTAPSVYGRLGPSTARCWRWEA